MGCKQACAVDVRMRFMMAVDSQEEAFAMVCRCYSVSRKTGYKWLGRFRAGGVTAPLATVRS